MEVSDVRRHIRRTIEQARQNVATRRATRETAERDYEQFLGAVAVPVFRVCANVLKAEGYPFELVTPPGTVRLVPERSARDFIELGLDASRDPAIVMGRVCVGRERETTASERPVRTDVSIDGLTDEDVLRFLLAELEPFVA